MSTTVNPPAVEQPKPFDSAAYLAARNAGEAAAKMPGQPVPKVATEAKPVATETTAPVTPPVVEDDDKPPAQLPRWARREINRAKEQAAEERGRRMALESMMAKPAAPEAPKADTEPQRDQFKTDAEYAAGVARWAAKSEVGKTVREVQSNSQAQASFDEQISVAKSNYAEQSENIPEWPSILKKAEELELNSSHHLFGLFSTSEFQAPLTEHFVNNPKDFEKLLEFEADISGKDSDKAQKALMSQVKFFNRLEGRVETVYTDRQKAAQASKAEKPDKERTDPEKAEQARVTAVSPGKETRLPKPSSEVAAKGGTAPPLEPKIGSKEWMDQRNAAYKQAIY